MAKVDIFQDGQWKEALVIAEDGDDIAYLEPETSKVVYVKRSTLPYKDEAEAQAVRTELKNQENNA